ncbi:type IV pilus modification PilV family protein [Desulfosporosinus youngiae]|uniref:Prepilin-type N-terminal cleavage/methylation domain-containing protein n=1 Tax=Desulfosporosinus youngiae DSM 17734 TaxID=768710 RepID=H5XSH3_9FIRM|nr:prepilin-type N-terminal cleavage/methylation domain-containing protein [Desulfosporosinus youngiae]EHQ88073.1 prepilin-type N-terminal cleavage/methylation domain-containing protein [Desulfosporosinus youngiae DSM 17734]
MLLSKRGHSERGLTLMEVIFALLISGIFLMVSMRLLTDQWRGSRALKNYLEAHYAVMTAGKTVSDAIRTAETANWTPGSKVLQVLPLRDDTNPRPTLDSYFMDDLDRDGKNDLYWRHLGVSQPVASYLTGWKCVEVEPGLWEIFLEANMDGQTATWQSTVRQRIYPPIPKE